MADELRNGYEIQGDAMCAKIAVSHLINFNSLSDDQKDQLNKMKQNLQQRRDELDEAIKTIDARLGSRAK